MKPGDRDPAEPASYSSQELDAADAKAEVLDPDPPDPLERAVEFAAQVSLHRGPLPSPEMLRDYDSVLPGTAKRIIDQWERETSHRQELQRRIVSAFIAGRSRGQVFALVVILLLGSGGILLVALDKQLVGLIGFLSALAMLAASFLPGVRAGASSSRDADSEDEDEVQ